MVIAVRAAAFAAAMTLLSAYAAAARLPTAADLLNLRELGDYRGGLSVSPDGRHVAFFERETVLNENGYRYRLLVMPSVGGAPRVLAEAGDIILRNTQYGPTGAALDRAPLWSPGGDMLAYLAARDDRIELWRVGLNGGSPRLVVDGPGDVLRFAWTDSQNLVVETTAPRETQRAFLRRADAQGFHPDDHLTPYASLRPRFPYQQGSEQFVIDWASGARRTPSGRERDSLDGPPRSAALQSATAQDQTSDALVWLAPRTPNDPASSPRLGLYHASLDGGDVRRCEHVECSGRMLGVWGFAGSVVIRRMEGHGAGLTALYEWRVADNTVRRIRRADEELFGCGRAGARLVCLQESPLQPRRIVSITLSTGAADLLYDPNPHWRRFDLPRVDTINAHDAYGNETFAHLVFPAGYREGRRYPVVIVQYRSRGFLRGGVGNEFPIFALAARGYLVLSVDRPEWREAEEVTSATDLALGTELDNSENLMKQSALEAMLAELDWRGLSDTRRIGITGLSDGAETVYWAITRSTLFAAAVASSPPTDPTAWTLGAASFRQSLLRDGAGGPWADAANPWAAWWARNSTALHAEAIGAPLLMSLSESEALMGLPLMTRLQELARPVDMYLYPGACHIKWRPAQLLAAQARAMDWLDFWLRGVEREDPDEPGRLGRWRALRDRAARR